MVFEDEESDWHKLVVEELPAILDVISRSDVEEIEIASGERSLRIKLGPRGGAEDSPLVETRDESSEAVEAGGEGVGKMRTVAVKSDRVGTFYRAAASDGAPVRNVLDQVARGDPVGFVDSLNILHELAAPESGSLIGFSVEDGDDVEYGQEIALIALQD